MRGRSTHRENKMPCYKKDRELEVQLVVEVVVVDDDSRAQNDPDRDDGCSGEPRLVSRPGSLRSNGGREGFVMGLLVVDIQRLRAILVWGRKGLFVVFAAGHDWLEGVAGSDKAVGARRG